MTSEAPTIHDAAMVWMMRGPNEGVNTTSRKLVMNAWSPWPTSSTLYPAGVCIQELAMTIQVALNVAPTTTMVVAKSHILLPSRVPPNSIRPRNPPSSMKAKMPSAASRLPKMLPTNREYSDQLVPNWNSWTMPVAMPMAKISP